MVGPGQGVPKGASPKHLEQNVCSVRDVRKPGLKIVEVFCNPIRWLSLRSDFSRATTSGGNISLRNNFNLTIEEKNINSVLHDNIYIKYPPL